MARILGRNAEVYANQYYISGRMNTVSLNMSVETPEVTSFGESNRTRLPNGITDNEMSLNGFFDNAASQVDVVFSGLHAASGVYGIYYEGATACKLGREFTGIMTAYVLDESVEGAAAVSATVAGSSATYFTMTTGATACSNSASMASASFTGSINMGGSSASVVNFFRVMSLDRTSNQSIAASAQDSANDSAWATTAVFTTASTAGIQFTATASAAQYRRLRYQLLGTSPISACFMFSSGSIPY